MLPDSPNGPLPLNSPRPLNGRDEVVVDVGRESIVERGAEDGGRGEGGRGGGGEGDRGGVDFIEEGREAMGGGVGVRVNVLDSVRTSPVSCSETRHP